MGPVIAKFRRWQLLMKSNETLDLHQGFRQTYNLLHFEFYSSCYFNIPILLPPPDFRCESRGKKTGQVCGDSSSLSFF